MSTKVDQPKPLRFWLIAGTLSARIETSPGCHVITEVSASGCFDSDGPDDEELARAIAGVLYFGDAIAAGYQGTDESLTAAQAAADAAWDAHVHCASCGESVPNADWLSRDSKCGRCFVVEMSEAA